MSRRPYMKLWVSDFLGDTFDLDGREVGAYLLILMALWQRGGSLPADEKKLQKVARIGREWPKVWASISRFFVVEDGAIYNPRLTRNLHETDAKSARLAQSGARGGSAKALKSKDVPLADATKNPSEAIAIAIATEEVREEKSSEPSGSATSRGGKEAGSKRSGKQIFDVGVGHLMGAGASERRARSLVARWRKDASDSAVAAALRECVETEPTDPVAWMEAKLKEAVGQADAHSRAMSIMDRIIAEKEKAK